MSVPEGALFLALAKIGMGQNWNGSGTEAENQAKNLAFFMPDWPATVLGQIFLKGPFTG